MKYILVFTLFIINLNALYLVENEFNEKVYVRTYGKPINDAIIFVHGMGDEASTTWDETIESLRDDYYILTFDLPGFGKSTKSNQLYSIKRYVKFIHNIKNKFIHKKYHLIGHSMGGAISLKYAYTYQNELKSLVLIDAAGILSKQAFSQFMIKNGITDFFGTSVKDLNLDVAIAKIPGVIESFIPLNIESFIESPTIRKNLLQSNPTAISALSLVKEDFSGIPENIYLNTRIIWGEDDNIAPLRTGYVLNKLIKNSKLNIIKDAKHVPIVDSFNTYISYIKDHLKKPYYRKIVNKKVVVRKKNIILEDVNGKIISGDIEDLELVNCKNIMIKDANINKFTIINSRVNILHTNFNIKEASYIIDSTIDMTAGSIKNSVPIEIYKSNIDFAGIDIISLKETFLNQNLLFPQKFIFSLSTLNDIKLHGVYKIKKKDSYLYKVNDN